MRLAMYIGSRVDTFNSTQPVEVHLDVIAPGLHFKEQCLVRKHNHLKTSPYANLALTTKKVIRYTELPMDWYMKHNMEFIWVAKKDLEMITKNSLIKHVLEKHDD